MSGAELDTFDAILDMSEEALDEELRAMGVDPVALGERGAAFVTGLQAEELHLPAFLASLPELAAEDAQAAYKLTFERTVRAFRAGREAEAERLGAVMAVLVREHEEVQP